VKPSLKRAPLFAATFSLIILGGVAAAQQRPKTSRIGFLSTVAPLSERLEAFQQGLRELGYIEGQNIIVDYRSAEGKADRLSDLAAEFARLKPDLIVSAGPTVTRVLKQATRTIPIVMAQDTDPVGNGFVANLARPGGNITGLATLSPELSGKRLELVKEIIPRLSRVAVFGTSTQPGTAESVKELETAARALALQLEYFELRNSKDVDNSFETAAQRRIQAVVTLQSPVVSAQRKQIAELANKNRLPVIYSDRQYASSGGLISYGVSAADLWRRAAYYVDKILKGAKPADLPVEQPTKFELVINLKTAKQIGLTIPPNVLARADRVIK
jgi:putative tryptophan/tyrosine transport system substrate-binding protein